MTRLRLILRRGQADFDGRWVGYEWLHVDVDVQLPPDEYEPPSWEVVGAEYLGEVREGD